MTLEEYFQENETSPFGRWFSTLDVQAAFRVSTALVRLELGNTSNIKWFEGLGYRIYLVQEGKRLIILFSGGDKSTQKADIKAVKTLIAEFRTRKKAERTRRESHGAHPQLQTHHRRACPA
nr:type II toxin-antitoxin system RelE/ParE family toxin [Pseudomonas sp. 3296]